MGEISLIEIVLPVGVPAIINLAHIADPQQRDAVHVKFLGDFDVVQITEVLGPRVYSS